MKNSTDLKVFIILTIIHLTFGYKSIVFDKIKPDNSYSISGIVRGAKFERVYLAHFDVYGKISKVDSTTIEDGNFSFSGIVNEPEGVMLGLRQLTKNGKKSGVIYQGEFILDKGKLQIICHNDSLKYMNAYGTVGQDQFAKFLQKALPVFNELNNIRGERDYLNKKDHVEINKLDALFRALELKKRNIILEHVKQYPSSIVSAYIIKRFFNKSDNSILNDIFQILSKDVKESIYGMEVEKLVISNNRISNGKNAPQFSVPNKYGKIISLNNFLGKYVLIDFWASWCVPCREENPNLVEIYKTFKNKKFEIIGVSMDTDRKKWLDAVNHDKLTWQQVSDLKGSKSKLKELYGVSTIPMNFLINPNGEIIAQNLRSQELLLKLRELKL